MQRFGSTCSLWMVWKKVKYSILYIARQITLPIPINCAHCAARGSVNLITNATFSSRFTLRLRIKFVPRVSLKSAQNRKFNSHAWQLAVNKIQIDKVIPRALFITRDTYGGTRCIPNLARKIARAYKESAPKRLFISRDFPHTKAGAPRAAMCRSPREEMKIVINSRSTLTWRRLYLGINYCGQGIWENPIISQARVKFENGRLRWAFAISPSLRLSSERAAALLFLFPVHLFFQKSLLFRFTQTIVCQVWPEKSLLDFPGVVWLHLWLREKKPKETSKGKKDIKINSRQ